MIPTQQHVNGTSEKFLTLRILESVPPTDLIHSLSSSFNVQNLFYFYIAGDISSRPASGALWNTQAINGAWFPFICLLPVTPQCKAIRLVSGYIKSHLQFLTHRRMVASIYFTNTVPGDFTGPVVSTLFPYCPLVVDRQDYIYLILTQCCMIIILTIKTTGRFDGKKSRIVNGWVYLTKV